MRGSRRRGFAAGAGVAVAVLVAALVAVLGSTGGHGAPTRRRTATQPPDAPTRTTSSGATTEAPAPPAPNPVHHPRITVAAFAVRITDPGRTMPSPSGPIPRSFEAIIRFPMGRRGPFPVIVFGHGFAVTPAPYAPLLRAWARAGYIVAAPVFPLENKDAPGGPNERDLPNQPADMSRVIDYLLGPRDPVRRLLARHAIAVAGQSDGGDTALASAFDPRVRDPRVRAAVILSGAFDPFISSFAMPDDRVALLATQGTADTINPPALTRAFYVPASPPKYLLQMLGAGHLPPYTQPGPVLSSVARVSLAFLGCYLERRCAALRAALRAGRVGPETVLTGRA